MNIDKIHNVYLIGIGGIGMSALARYFLQLGKLVAGYDHVSKPLTSQLIEEGVNIHFVDSVELIPEPCFDPDTTLVIYTPAVPNEHNELLYFRNNNFRVMKRAEVLGFLSKNYHTIAIAGTHGKTTISTLIAHVFNQTKEGCNAFLGGLSKNFNSNFLLNKRATNLIVEADEFDRSFLTLYPSIALITSIDEDHLDIYSDKKNLLNSFNDFVNQINEDGLLILSKGLEDEIRNKEIKLVTYSLKEKADFYVEKIKLENGYYRFNVRTPNGLIKNLKLGVPGEINVENAVGAIAVCLSAGVGTDDIKKGLESFYGIIRRFDVQIMYPNLIYIDDYAHHPAEIEATVNSVRKMYPQKDVTGIFQPHLYSRTRDFASEFAKALDLLDELILLDIYPAREKPIEGVSSNLISKKMKKAQLTRCSKEQLLSIIKGRDFEVLLTLGAGDIDQMVRPIKHILEKRIEQ